MDDIVILTGEQLSDALEMFRLIGDEETIYELRVCIDEGLKFKANNRTWSPPLGRIEEGELYENMEIRNRKHENPYARNFTHPAESVSYSPWRA